LQGFQDKAMKQITVVVHGALGKVGREVVTGVLRDPDLSLVGAVDIQATGKYLGLPDAGKEVPLAKDLGSLLQTCHPQVIVDFTIAEAAIAAARIAIKQGVNLVIGTTGISDSTFKEIDELAMANNVGVVAAPNFALGAVVLMHLAKIAAKYFDHAEIIELHHNQKTDAPSGTALATAKGMAQARGKKFFHAPTKKENIGGTRGGQVEGIAIHSVRLPGLVASEEVIFGGEGQTLSLRHDTLNRECFIPGVILAIKGVVNRQGLIFGLDELLNLGG
jgi:4-hydroxy-tetrahydrodipicolinate reductase